MSTQFSLPLADKNEHKAYKYDAGRVTGLDQIQLEQRLYSVTNRLMTTLDIEKTIEMFMQSAAEDIAIDGYQYKLPHPATEIRNGRQSRNSCAYNLRISDRELGELSLYRGRRFNENELEYLEKLLCALVYPLRNAIKFSQVQLMAHQDALTGLNNRGAFDCNLKREISLAERHDRPLTLLLIDIDHFKSVNDQFGHAAGDEVLKVVADSMKEVTRGSDVLFRYGGEEFAILLGDISLDVATLVADRIRDALKNKDIIIDDKRLDITISVGAACLKDGEDGVSLFNRADKALYKAKHAGRNQVVTAA